MSSQDQPTSNPPGGGSWRWDATNACWIDAATQPATPPDTQQAEPTEDPQE